MGDIFDEINNMNLPDLKNNNIKDKIDEVNRKLEEVGKDWHDMVDFDQEEFKKWVRENKDKINNIYNNQNFKNLIIDYISYTVALEYPQLIMLPPEAVLSICYGAFFYGYYAAKVKNL